MKVTIDKGQFGPWALVTGASSGIGKEFARQIAASGINVVLVARRDALLAELGRAISQEFGVQYRALAMDLSQEGFIAGLADATNDLDIGLVVSNAGTGNPGEFLKLDRQLLQETLRLSTMAHLDIAHHFGQKLGERRRGGITIRGVHWDFSVQGCYPSQVKPGLKGHRPWQCEVPSLAFVYDLKRIPVRIKYIGRVVSRIVFRSCPRRNIVSGASGYCRPVEFIDHSIAFGHEPPMNRLWIRLPLLDPEERSLAIAKSPKIRMITFALEG